MQPASPLQKEVARLREKLDVANETIRQMREAMTPPVTFPHEWNLTPMETAVLATLYAARHIVSEDKMLIAVDTFRSDCSTKGRSRIIPVHISHLRVKTPDDVIIENHHGLGWKLTPSSRAYLKAILENQA